MGTAAAHPAHHSTMADALFTATQQRVLGALFGQPARTFYANELIGLVRGGKGAVQREIARLVSSGLVTVHSVGNQRHYRANPDAPIFAELTAIAQKTFALAEPLRQGLSSAATAVVAAFVYGSIAKRQDSASSDVDLMVVSDTVGYRDLYPLLEKARVKLGRPVNATILTRAEFETRRKGKDSFLTRVLAQPKIWVIGNPDDLES